MDTVTEEQRQLINDCLKRINRASAWEKDFIAHLVGKVGRLTLTEREDTKLNEVWERLTEDG